MAGARGHEHAASATLLRRGVAVAAVGMRAARRHRPAHARRRRERRRVRCRLHRQRVLAPLRSRRRPISTRSSSTSGNPGSPLTGTVVLNASATAIVACRRRDQYARHRHQRLARHLHRQPRRPDSSHTTRWLNRTTTSRRSPPTAPATQDVDGDEPRRRQLHARRHAQRSGRDVAGTVNLTANASGAHRACRA